MRKKIILLLIVCVLAVTATLNITQSQAESTNAGASKGKNQPCPSLGCGKDLSDLKSGAYTITSAGLSRKYIIDIPADYDKNKPYRLIFGMHMMGGNMNTVVSMKYYGLKTYADNEKVPIIFVAPEGNSDNSPWRVRDDKDHVFFADMLKLFKEKLCVDHFANFLLRIQLRRDGHLLALVGFSERIAAVACYAPANWNIYLLPTPTSPSRISARPALMIFFVSTSTQMQKKKGENIAS